MFTDAYEEPNGVASLSREFANYAQRQNLPMLVVRGGNQTRLIEDGSVSTLLLKRGPASFPVDQDLYCDPAFVRHMKHVTEVLREFKPNVIHVTGPGDMGICGARLAHLERVPLVASWHTNLHEYAAKRVRKGCRFLPGTIVDRLAKLAEAKSLDALLWFYKKARLTMAPNAELVELLKGATRRPCTAMLHGVDLERFRPCRRKSNPGVFTIGYVGRLTSEKNVRKIAEIEAALDQAGAKNFRLVLVGDGGERGWLQQNLKHAELRGVLRGDALADAFAEFDAFVFPSQTDTFGLVVLEAMASGVPVIVARGGGPQYQVTEGVNGFVADSIEDFVSAILRLQSDEQLLSRMRAGARVHASDNSWTPVFHQVYETYRQYLFSN